MIFMGSIDTEKIRGEFPILGTKMNGKPLVYLDNAATSQKPVQVIDAVSGYYREYNANIHRGIYRISERATEEYVRSKEDAAKLINCGSHREIVYVRNATEAINVVALSWGEKNIRKGDRILISSMEHHSNIVPWQMLAGRKGAEIDYVKLIGNSTLDMEDLKEKLEKKPKLVAITHASNVLGTINDVKTITRLAHKTGAKVLVDGAQSAPHMPVDVKDIGCDFFVLSSHKMLGPAGIGVLWAGEQTLEEMDPVYGGGDMIKTVSFKGASWNDLPWKFEAGTPNIEGGIGFGAAVRYLIGIGMRNIRDHETAITRYALEKMQGIGGVRVHGPEGTENRGGIVAFSIDGVHAHDIAQVFDSEGIAIRSGHHCAMPLVRELLGESSLARMSFYLYNTESEVNAAVGAIEKTKRLFPGGAGSSTSF